MSRPLLLESDRIEGWELTGHTQDFTLHCGLHLGELAVRLENDKEIPQTADQILGLASKFPQDTSAGEIWRAALCRELMLLPENHYCRQLFKDILHGVCPFGPDFPEWSTFQNSQFAAALFPLVVEKRPAGVGQIWLTLSADIRSSTPVRLCEFCSKPDRMVWSSSGHLQKIEGSSWQLAAMLAQRAVVSSDSKKIIRLASQWIASGRVNADGSILGVDFITPKMNLNLLGPKRRWIFPADQPENSPHPNVFWSDHIDHAWRLVASDGITDTGAGEWPEQVEVLHTFVSEQPMTILLLTLLLPKLRRIVLWHTNDEQRSSIPARQLQKILSIVNPEAEIDEPRLISGNIMEVRDHIIPLLQKDLERVSPHTRVFFNITNGTLMMRYAILKLAESNPGLHLVYGELRNENDHIPGKASFFQITFPQGQPQMQRLNYSSSHLPGWDFSKLHSKAKLSLETIPEGFVKSLQAQ